MTQATVDTPRRRRPLRPEGEFVDKKVSPWQEAYIRRTQEALAALARLRRGVGKEVGAVPELWGYTLDGLPDQRPRDDTPTYGERAVYAALTLFALHQQSRGERMHRPGQSLGTAVRQLRVRSASPDAVRRRFEALGTAEAFPEVLHHARGLITQLRSSGIPLDYGSFADDLVLLQTRAASQVRLQWGRDFYRTSKNQPERNSETGNPAADAAPTDEEA